MSSINTKLQEALDTLSQKNSSDQFVTLLKKYTKNVIQGRMPPLQALGLSPNLLERYYSKALLLYNSGKYREAIKLFRVMTILSPYEYKFPFGLAAALHRNGEYVTAVAAYQFSSQADPLNPLPYYHSADCLLHLGYKQAAKEALRVVISSEDCSYETIKDRARLTLKKLESVEDARR